MRRLDAQLATDHASRFTTSDGPWERWVDALEQLRAIRASPLINSANGR
ncbi:DUF6000 family protein [Streptomyces sp. SAS_272]